MSKSKQIDLAALTKTKWEEDLRKNQRTFTADIWEWEEWLKLEGWTVDLGDKTLPEFHTYADFTNKVLRNNNVKAFHAHYALKAVIGNIFAGETGRILFHWEEIQDEAHRHVRDGEEWKGDELYGTVWYSREMFQRELADGEEPPAAEYPDAIIHVEPRIS